MNDRSMTIAILCSHLCVGEGISPLEPKEYSTFAAELGKKQINPEDLLSFSRQDFLQKLNLTENQAERILRLMDRSGSLSFEISKYEGMGISLLTRADPTYPKKLKTKLKNSCPPLFYTAGDLSLLEREAIGYVGSRSISDNDIAFARATVRKTVEKGYAVVSGGAKGSDSVAEEEALTAGGAAIAFLSDSLLRKIRNKKTIQAVQQGSLTGIAMMRNKYIYAQSEATIVIKANYEKGGTWNGAIENLNNKWALPLCWNHISYPGNKALIEKGSIPIGEEWDGNLAVFIEKVNQEKTEQLSIFDL